MKKIIFAIFVVAMTLLLLYPDSVTGRGARGGGGRGGLGGGARVSGGGGGARVSGGGARVSGGGYSGGRVGGGAVGSYGGGGVSAGRSASVVGPGGGVRNAGAGGGSYTTKGGSTIDYKGAAIGGTTPGGVHGGRYAGGIQVTTPGGRELTKVGHGGGVAGPGGNAIGGRSGVTVGTGPNGAIAGRHQGGVAIGPQGGIAGGSRVGVAAGAGGVVAGGSRNVLAGTPYGAVAGRAGVVAGRGTYYRSATAIRSQGAYVRTGVANYPCFRRGWYARYPGAWFAAGWAASAVWRACTWANCAAYCAYPVQPIYYDYGENVVYQDDGVYFDGQRAYAPEEYARLAINLADTGRTAQASKEEEWMPLGVFAMVHDEDTVSNHIFQLAVNKQGVIRGNYYDAVTDTTSQVYGAVNKDSQRAAWTIGDQKAPVFEVGIANLTKDETTMLVHYAEDRSEQFALIRVEDPEGAEGK